MSSKTYYDTILLSNISFYEGFKLQKSDIRNTIYAQQTMKISEEDIFRPNILSVEMKIFWVSLGIAIYRIWFKRYFDKKIILNFKRHLCIYNIIWLSYDITIPC